MYDCLLKLTYKIENNTIISSIRRGFIMLIPILLVGAFSVLIRNFPVAGFMQFQVEWCGGILSIILNFMFDSTVGFMAAYLVMSISFYYSETMKIQDQIGRGMAMVTSLACFVAAFGAASGSMEMADFGPVGVFTAMITSIAATRLYYLFYGWGLKRMRLFAPGADLEYRNSFSSILPVAACVVIFSIGNLLIQDLFHQENLNDLITNAIVKVFRNLSGELSVGILYVLILNLFWVFGIHGGDALEPVSQAYLAPGDAATGVISKSFLDNFALIGGCGTSICLLAALLLFSRRKGNRQLARYAAPAIVFNINEILVYGLPVVLNPLIVVPFILTPLCSLLIGYGAIATGLVPMVTRSVAWTTPVFFSGYLATGSLRGVALQVVIVIVGTAVYAPFVVMSERIHQSQTKMIIDELTGYLKECQQAGTPCRLLKRGDNLGVWAKNLTIQLRTDIEEGRLPLGYQPQYTYDGRLVGAEALLRWSYMGHSVYPPLAVELALEDGLYDHLTHCVLETAMRDLKRLKDKGKEISISVNVTAGQLDSFSFVDMVVRMAGQYGVKGCFWLEVTEETSIDAMTMILTNIRWLKENGIKVAVDDFSMGKTSLKYLRDSSFDMVKLDGELVRQIVKNDRSREIVASLVSLGKSLKFGVIAEFVENEVIRDELHKMGCDLYQGYYYSPAVPIEKLEEMF